VDDDAWASEPAGKWKSTKAGGRASAAASTKRSSAGLSSADRMMALNSLNHLAYAVLFIVRSVFFTDAGSGDRPFYFESILLGWMIPSWLGVALGWSAPYDQAAVLGFVVSVNEASSTTYQSAFFQACVGSPDFMFWYQVAEGTFHLMIVAGSLWLCTRPSLPWLKTLYLAGLWLEIIVMDITYTFAYTLLAARESMPGYYGLVFLMMLVHHLTVLPDLLSASLEARRPRGKVKSK